ncbi:ribosomal L1 domain-containing protein 1 [Protopterus annectens]|uniref:ribosomal L1 domain-containing protein 1 n=1 Tax=Protopterus annectens TaxID=7888 RepID=UPI001CF93BB9|nr:ribosomal L1 domain-containing protein 1 [Protopterus annectens]
MLKFCVRSTRGYLCSVERLKMDFVDTEQVKKAVKALLAYYKNKEDLGNQLLMDKENLFMSVTVWKVPNKESTIKISLPHAIRPETTDVCLFTRDEANMTAEQTEKFYRQLLDRHGIKQITRIIPYKILKTEYKPYESKRRLLSSFDLFLSDSRIRRLLPSLVGKHFYQAKRAPLSVELTAKNLSKELNKVIQGTILPVTHKGCCYTVRVGHTSMKAEEVVENISTVVSVIAEKLPMKWENVKMLHLKTETSAALPIYTSSLRHMDDIFGEPLPSKNLQKRSREKNKKRQKGDVFKKAQSKTPVSPEADDMLVETDLKKKKKKPKKAIVKKIDKSEKEEEIPELIPIQSSCTPEKVKKTAKKNVLSSDVKSSFVRKTPKRKLAINDGSGTQEDSKVQKVDASAVFEETEEKRSKFEKKLGNKTPQKKVKVKRLGGSVVRKNVMSATKAIKTPRLKPKKMKTPKSV